MWGSLDVLDVGVFLPLDTAGGKLLVGDSFTAVVTTTGSLPVPVESAHVLHAGHFLVSQVGDDLDHGAAVAVEAEDLVVNQVGADDPLLVPEGGGAKAGDVPLGLDNLLPQMSFHSY